MARPLSFETPDWLRHYRSLSTRPDRAGVARRTFLQGLLATGVLSATGLQWLRNAPIASALGPDDRILVVVLMGGGNDGFSMVIPAEDGRYQSARGSLAIQPNEAIALESGVYLHGNLSGLAARYAAGEVAVVRGLGDPFDDRSHFSSMARWMRGASDSSPIGFTGWLGRWLDGAGLSDLGGISVGDGGAPLHIRGATSQVTALSTYGNLYGASVEPWEVPAIDALLEIGRVGPGGVWPNRVASATASAIAKASEVAPIYRDDLPERGIQRDLALAAEAINLDVGARIVTVAFGDFDTHDDHRPRHEALMLAFDQAVTEFFTRLNPTFADRVTLMTFSEFGRSWTANGSAGVDHGTASNALVIGRPVRGGLYGATPSFDTFDLYGDLESTVDFRSYYATILDGWLRARQPADPRRNLRGSRDLHDRTG